MSSMNVLSVTKSDENTDISYVFDIMYGTETFQIRKTTEELRNMIATSVETFPALASDSQSMYDEASNSFLLENLKSYFNTVFDSMVNIFAYPSFLMHIDPASVPSTFMRVSIIMQDTKIRALNEKLDKLDNRMENTEKIIRECLALTEKLTSSHLSAEIPSSIELKKKDPIPDTGNSKIIKSSETAVSNPLSPSKGVEELSDKPDDFQSAPPAELDSCDAEPDIPDVPVPDLNQESLDKALNYFKSNLPQFSYFDREVSQFYEILQPSVKDMNVRSTIVDYLKSQIRLSLSCSLFVTDLEMIDCCTFTENKIVINLLIGKSYQASWDSILLEHLNYISESSTYMKSFGFDKSTDLNAGSNEDPADISTVSTNDFTQPFPSNSVSSPGGDQAFKVQDILLHNASPQNQEGNTTLTAYLTCKVNDTFVEIRGNPLGDLCLLSLMEEISLAIGKDKLFKKSLTIITEFFHHELSELYSKSQNKQENGKRKLQRDFFPDSILWIMVISIFNKFYNIIESPFQALLLFLMEYSFYNPEQSIITIYGLMELPPLNPSQPTNYILFLNKPNALLKPTILEKYWNFLNVEEAMVNNEIFNSTLVGNPVVQKKFQPNAATFPIFEFFTNGLTALHPFNHTVIQSGRIAMNTSNQQIREVFQFGLLKVMNFIEDLSALSNQVGSVDQMKFDLFFTSIFPEIKKNVLNRGDSQTKSRPQLEQESPTLKKEKMMDFIFYCNFILKSIITEQALLYACLETIDMKGTLPVGEIGKVITVHSNIAQLSLHLKEKFGGLKKFLERFPTFFVFGNDHQYNPHVYLRNKLSPEHQQMIYRGVLPMQIILQYKKAKLSKKISKKFSAMSTIVDGSNESNLQGAPYQSDENSSDGSHHRESTLNAISDPFAPKSEGNSSTFPYFENNLAAGVPPPQLKPPGLPNSSRPQPPAAPSLSLNSYNSAGAQFGQNSNVLAGRNPSVASFGASYGRSTGLANNNSLSSLQQSQSSSAGYPNISFPSNPASTSSWSSYSAPASATSESYYNSAPDNYSQYANANPLPTSASSSSNYGLFNSSPKISGLPYRGSDSLPANNSYFQSNDSLNSSFYDIQGQSTGLSSQGYNPNSRGFFPGHPNSNKRF